MNIVAGVRTKTELEEIYKLCSSHDQAGSGKISKDELDTIFTDLFRDKVRAWVEVDEIYNKAKVDENGCIEYSGTSSVFKNLEYLTSLIKEKKQTEIKRLRNLFISLDEVK